MTDLEGASRAVDHYLKEYQNATDSYDKLAFFNKAVYWSIEMDIERAWENIKAEHQKK